MRHKDLQDVAGRRELIRQLAGVRQEAAGTTDHDRAVNNANEITGLTQRTGTWIPPDYDARGNMVKMPRPTAGEFR